MAFKDFASSTSSTPGATKIEYLFLYSCLSSFTKSLKYGHFLFKFLFEQKGKIKIYSPFVYCLINFSILTKDQDKLIFLILFVLMPLFSNCIFILSRTGSLSKSFLLLPGSRVVSVEDHWQFGSINFL